MTGPAAAFGDLITDLDGAMAVVTAASGGERAGCLIGFHAQCSIEPLRYVVWLSKANHTYRVALHARHIAVHFLARGDLDVARLFGTTSGDRTDKFAQCEWEPGPSGVPLLIRCRHRFVAERVALLDEGSDHVCLVVAPTDMTAAGRLIPLRLSDVTALDPGHEAEERPRPRTQRAE